MTALFVAWPLYPSESAAAKGDGLSAVMLWISLAVFWLLAAVGRASSGQWSVVSGQSRGNARCKMQIANCKLPDANLQINKSTNQQIPNPQSPIPNPLSALSGEGPGVRAGWIDAAVLLLLVCFAASTLWAVRHGSPRPAINVFWEWVGLGLCFLLARQLIDTEREVRAVAAVMIALAVALAGYGLYQQAYEMPQTRAFYRANPDAALRAADWWYPPGSPQRKLFEDRLANTEPTATFALTNSLAGFLTPWLVVLAGIACTELRDRKRLAGAIILFLPIGICLFLTHSRSGCIAALLGFALVWPIARAKTIRFRWKIPLAIVVAGGRSSRRPRRPADSTTKWPKDRSATACNTGGRVSR